jgi:hypothetical protein
MTPADVAVLDQGEKGRIPKCHQFPPETEKVPRRGYRGTIQGEVGN